MENKVKKLLSSVGSIPEKFWEKTDGGRYKVVWLLNRQKPSVEQSWDFDEERIGITDEGKVIWGFDSGCSCPSPWSQNDFGDDNYKTSPTYKEFILASLDFDKDWEKESMVKIDEILSCIKSEKK